MLRTVMRLPTTTEQNRYARMVEKSDPNGPQSCSDLISRVGWKLPGGTYGQWLSTCHRRGDGRWSGAVLDWKMAGGGRSVGRLLKRWGNDIDEHVLTRVADTLPGDWRILGE